MQMQLAYEEKQHTLQRAGKGLTQAGEVQGQWGPWMWRGYYVLKRMARRTERRGDREMGEQIEALAEQLHDEDFQSISWIGLAARWADLLVRNAHSETEES
jgi:hypothetical protein